LEDFGNILKEIVKNSKERRGCVVGWAMRDFKSTRPIHTSNSKKGMGCGNVFSFLNESRGFVEFYRIGSRFNFVASVAEAPSDLKRAARFWMGSMSR
jgi:hypothetical protein